MLETVFNLGDKVTFTDESPRHLIRTHGKGPFEVVSLQKVPYSKEVQSCLYCGCIVPNKERPTESFDEALDELIADVMHCEHKGESSYGGAGHPQYVEIEHFNERDPRPHPGRFTGAHLRLWTTEDQDEWEKLNRFPVHVAGIASI